MKYIFLYHICKSLGSIVLTIKQKLGEKCLAQVNTQYKQNLAKVVPKKRSGLNFGSWSDVIRCLTCFAFYLYRFSKADMSYADNKISTLFESDYGFCAEDLPCQSISWGQKHCLIRGVQHWTAPAYSLLHGSTKSLSICNFRYKNKVERGDSVQKCKLHAIGLWWSTTHYVPPMTPIYLIITAVMYLYLYLYLCLWQLRHLSFNKKSQYQTAWCSAHIDCKQHCDYLLLKNKSPYQTRHTEHHLCKADYIF